ncbi:MAG: tol-pal system protein YbgF [bacterium]|nr:tol-pal system protein YbgF [bacterium]
MKIPAMISIVASILVSLFLMFGCASQNEVATIDNRITELEMRNVETRKKSEALKTDIENREGEEQALRHQAASVRQQVAALNKEIRVLMGRIEELEFSINRQKKKDSEAIDSKQARLDQMADSARINDERIERIEQYLNFEASKPAVSPATTAPKIVPVAKAPQEDSEDEIYRQAKQAFDQGDSDAARAKFIELIERYPKSERADNAQFWIGEIYYREKWYEKAILEYQKVIENYPKGNKVPASLLKQGFAFLNLEDKANSRLILQELIKKYPKTNEAKIAKDKLNDLK